MPPKRGAKAARTEDGPDSASAGKGGGDDAHDMSRGNVEHLGADEKYKTGPFSLLYNAVHQPESHVLILCRNQKRIFARVRAFDRHFNMLLQGAQEISNEKDASGNNRMRNLDKMFLRGDSVISVVAMKS